MKNLDLATLSVVELNETEIENVNGGLIPLILGIFAVTGACYGAGLVAGEATYYLTH